MAIQQTTTITVTCDHCGKAIGEGETFHTLSALVGEQSHDGDGVTPSHSASVSATLCANDYEQLAKEAAGTLLAIQLLPEPEPA